MNYEELMKMKAHGWAIELKEWDSNVSWHNSKNGPIRTCDFKGATWKLIPPIDDLVESGMHIHDAAHKLQTAQCDYIRRADWPQGRKMHDDSVPLNLHDLTMDDWQAWRISGN